MTSIALAVIGAILGSFAIAQVWRLRARQLDTDKIAGEKVSATEYKRLQPLLQRSLRNDRSECLHCHHVLKWYDMVPVLSWMTLAGKCRYCHRRIGLLEPLAEIGLAVVFVVSYIFWPFALDSPLEWARLGIWLTACVLMLILFVYDAKWSLLPFGINIGLIAVGGVFLAISAAIDPFAVGDWWSLLAGVSILAGLYYLFSLPGWVGLGDSILGLGLALTLLGWERAALTLFLSNLLGCLMLIPLALTRKLTRGTHVPFGPFLIAAAFIAMLWGPALIGLTFDWSNAVLNPFMV